MLVDEVKDICLKYNIENWSLNEQTGLVDINGDVNLTGKILTELPLYFGNVTGSFWCDRNNLTTLKGAPISVGNFHCSYNKLSSLKYIPKYIGGDIFCNQSSFKQITINTWEYRWLFYSYIHGIIIASDNYKVDVFLNDNKNPPKSELPKLFAELKKFGDN